MSAPDVPCEFPVVRHSSRICFRRSNQPSWNSTFDLKSIATSYLSLLPHRALSVSAILEMASSSVTARFEADFKKVSGTLTLTATHVAWVPKEPGAMDRQNQAMNRVISGYTALL